MYPVKEIIANVGKNINDLYLSRHLAGWSPDSSNRLLIITRIVGNSVGKPLAGSLVLAGRGQVLAVHGGGQLS